LNKKKHHEYTLEVLPWFVNDTLDQKEREQVLKHLAQCEGCRQERDRLIELQKMIREGEVVDGDVEFSLRRTLKRIEEAERNRDSVADVRSRDGQRRLFASMALAAGLGVFLVGAAVLVGDPAQVVSEYQTLTSDQPGVAGAARQMEIGFVDPIPATTLRQALIETGSNIVSGPDEDGVYLVEVEVPSGISQQMFLRRIQDIEGVKHAAFSQ